MTCQTCGNSHQHNFCPNCGEKRYNPHSLSLKHVAEETLESFTHADHKLLRTVWTLIRQPGQLTHEYIRGRHVRYMKPLALFLVVNLIFFLVATYNSFNQPLYSFLNYDNYTFFGTKQAVNQLLTGSGQTLATYEPVFNVTMTANSKAYVVVLIPLYALLFALLFPKTNRTFLEHLIFSTHFITFILLLFIVQYFVIILPLYTLLDLNGYSSTVDMIVTVSTFGVLGFYLSVAFRRFYQVGKFGSISAALLSSVMLAVVIMAYRLLLFYKIVYFGH